MIDQDAGPPARTPASRAKRQAPELLPRVLEALPVGVALFELDADGFRFRCGNQVFGRVLSLDRMPDDGQLVGEVFHREEHDAVIELFHLVRVSREPQSYFTAEGGQGPETNRILNIDAYPMLKVGRVSHVLVLVEETQEKLQARQRQQLEANRLRKKADQLASLEKAKSEFLRLASHELRGPAATLGGYLSMIEDESLGPVPQQLRPVLPMLKAKAAQINLLANEMVEAARLEDGGVQLKRKRVDLRQVVRRSVAAAETTATPRHRIRLEDRAGRELWVLGDVLRLEIIIANLLDNAIKYSPKGGDVTAKLSTSGDIAVLSVRDHGIGIAAQDMERLFVRFSRLAQLNDVPGTGLGLYLARELARLHKGEIVCVSKLGEGSEFVLSLPVEPAGKKPLTLPALREAAAGCRACDLYKTGTQTVFGEGPEHAQLMFVGEQPGDREDIEGKPFVGPAGRVLDEALKEAGIDRRRVYVTNAVKHFKWKPQGKRRLHQKPNAAEITACRPWLDSEIAVVKPHLLVLLGATAAQALLGHDFRVSLQRGQLIERPGLPPVMATVHPSSILRAPDDETRELEMRAFIHDLRRLTEFLR